MTWCSLRERLLDRVRRRAIHVDPLAEGVRNIEHTDLRRPAVLADGIQTLACFWLSAATLCGLALNAAFGWSWADPLAGLALVPFILKEARGAWRGQGCGCTAVACHA